MFSVSYVAVEGFHLEGLGQTCDGKCDAERKNIQMVRYGGVTGSVTVPPITGAVVGPKSGTSPAFYAWEPSTWPLPPAKVDEEFVRNLAGC